MESFRALRAPVFGKPQGWAVWKKSLADQLISGIAALLGSQSPGKFGQVLAGKSSKAWVTRGRV